METDKHRFKAKFAEYLFLFMDIRTALTSYTHERPNRPNHEIQIGDVENWNQQNPRMRPVGPHEKGEEGEQNGNDWHGRMVAIYSPALVPETDNHATPVHNSDVNRGEKEKPSHQCYHDSHSEKIMEVFG
jgi:hypothetical protein